MSDIKIKKQNVLDAYKNASDEHKELLEHLFGSEVFKPADVRERIKTFADAATAVGIEDPEEWEEQYSDLEPDVLAYFKLRIITKALNEGWEPQFTEDEWRWFPWHYLWSESELDEKSDEWKADRHLIMIGDKYQSEYAGLASALSTYAPSNSSTDFGSRLCFIPSEA